MSSLPCVSTEGGRDGGCAGAAGRARAPGRLDEVAGAGARAGSSLPAAVPRSPSKPAREGFLCVLDRVGGGGQVHQGIGKVGEGRQEAWDAAPKTHPVAQVLRCWQPAAPCPPAPSLPPTGLVVPSSREGVLLAHCWWGGSNPSGWVHSLQHPGDGQSLPAGPAETPGPLSCPACCEGPGLGQSQQRPRGGLRAPPQVPAPLPGAACSPPRCSHPRSSAGQTECPGPRPQPHMASIQAGPLRPLHSAPPRPAQEGASSCTAQTGTVAGAGWAGSWGWAEAAQWVWGLKSGSLSRVTLHCVTLDTKANLSQPVSWSAKWVHTQNPDQHVLKGAPFTTGATGPASALSWRCCELGHWEPVPGRQQGTVEALRGAGVSYRAGQGSQQGPTGRVSAHPDERPLHLASPELWVGSPPACRASCPWWEPARQAAVGRLGLSCPSGVLSSPCPQPGRRGGLPAVLDAPRPPP